MSYNQLKLRFYRKYHKSPIQEIPTSIEIFGVDFHIRLVQDAIKYMFLVLTNPDMPFSELHNFYFKMLYFYDKLDLILFAQDVDNSPLKKLYSNYTTTGTLRRKTKLHESMMDDKHNAFLMSSIVKTANLSKPFEINTLNAYLGKSKTPRAMAIRPKNVDINNIVIDFDEWVIKQPKRINKVYADMLPVGHFIKSEKNQVSTNFIVPTVFDPSRNTNIGQKLWFEATDFTESIPNEVENDLIIGYYDQNITGIDLKFKLRAPKQKKIKYDDSRLIERGSACNTRKKEELIEIIKLLKIPITQTGSIRNICSSIKLELLKREMLERRKVKAAKKSGKKYKKIRWFYMHFEKQPDE